MEAQPTSRSDRAAEDFPVNSLMALPADHSAWVEAIRTVSKAAVNRDSALEDNSQVGNIKVVSKSAVE